MWLITLGVTMVVMVWYSRDNEDLDAAGVTWKIYHHSHNCHSIIIVIIIVLTHCIDQTWCIVCSALYSDIVNLDILHSSCARGKQLGVLGSHAVKAWSVAAYLHGLLEQLSRTTNGKGEKVCTRIRDARTEPMNGAVKGHAMWFIRAYDDPWRAYLLTSEWMVILWLHCLWLHSVERKSWDF